MFDLSLQLTSSCPLSCIYCYVDQPTRDAHHRMTFDVAQRAVEFAWGDAPPGQRVRLTFSCVEPLTHFELIREVVPWFANWADSRKLAWECALMTNGALITSSMARWFADHPFKLIGVSIDGPPETHNRQRSYRDGRGSYMGALRGLELLRLAGCSQESLCLSGRYTGLSLQIDESIEHLLSLIDEGFASHCQFLPARVKPDNPCALTEEMMQTTVRAAHGRFTEWAIERARAGLSTPVDCFGPYVWRLIKKDKEAPSERSTAPCVCRLQQPMPKAEQLHACSKEEVWCTVDWDGSIYRCVCQPNRRIGHIDVGYDEQRDDVPIHSEDCLACSDLSVCEGSCMKRSSYIYNDPVEPDPIRCAHTSIVIEDAQRFIATLGADAARRAVRLIRSARREVCHSAS